MRMRIGAGVRGSALARLAYLSVFIVSWKSFEEGETLAIITVWQRPVSES